MPLSENCLRLRIYIGESDRWQHQPLYEALVYAARENGLAGATVFRSPMGFGAHSAVYTAKIINLSTDLPMVVEFIDDLAKIEAFIEKAKPMLANGLVTSEPIKVHHYQ